jgi:hypothetical protein
MTKIKILFFLTLIFSINAKHVFAYPEEDMQGHKQRDKRKAGPHPQQPKSKKVLRILPSITYVQNNTPWRPATQEEWDKAEPYSQLERDPVRGDIVVCMFQFSDESKGIIYNIGGVIDTGTVFIERIMSRDGQKGIGCTHRCLRSINEIRYLYSL